MNYGCCSGPVRPVLGSEQHQDTRACVRMWSVKLVWVLALKLSWSLGMGKFMQICSDMELIEPHR